MLNKDGIKTPNIKTWTDTLYCPNSESRFEKKKKKACRPELHTGVAALECLIVAQLMSSHYVGGKNPFRHV